MIGSAARERSCCCCESCDLEFRLQGECKACPECGSKEIVVKDLYEGANYTVRELVASKNATEHIKSRDGKLMIGETRVRLGSRTEDGLVGIRIRESDKLSYANTTRVQSYLMDKNIQLVEKAAYEHGERVVNCRYPTREKVGL